MSQDQEISIVLNRIITVHDDNILLNLRILDLSKFNLEQLLDKGLLKVSETTQNSYSLIILPANELTVPLSHMSTLYTRLPRPVRKNLKRFYILSPSWSLRMYLNLLMFMASPKFFKKIRWVDHQFIAPYFFTFGVDLQIVMTDRLLLPKVVEDSISLISKNLKVVGIFRSSPSIKLLGKVKTAYNYGDPGDLALDKVNDVHLACSLLKMFVRELPLPIFGGHFLKDLTGN